MICLSTDDRSQINLFSSDNNEKFLYVSFIFFIYGSLNFSRRGQVIRKWTSSSMLFLHKLQIRSSTFVPIYLPFSMFKLWALILNFVNSFLCCLVPNNKYGSNLKIDLNFLYVLNLFLEFGLTLLSLFRLSVQFCLNLSFKQYLTLHNWNIVESGVKHHQTNKQTNKNKHLCIFKQFERELRFIIVNHRHIQNKSD